MIIFKFKEELEDRGLQFPCSAFRWTFQIDKWFMGFVHQFKIDNKWCDSHTLVWGITVDKYWRWGIDHVYYDGPHCSFNIGPIHIVWGGNIRTHWCEKCMPSK